MRAATLALTASALSCAGAVPGVRPALLGASDLATGGQGGGVPLQTGVPLSPSGAGAQQYLAPAPPGGGPEGDPLRRAILDAVVQVARAAQRPVPAHDTRLDRAANDLVRSARGSAELPAIEVWSFFLRHYGVIEPDSVLFRSDGLPDDAAALADIRGQLPDLLKRPPTGRIGIGIDRGGSSVAVLIALQEQDVELAAVPRKFSPGGGSRLAGRLRGGLTQPEVLVTIPAGAVNHLVVRGDGAGFSGGFACNAGNGTYQIEITAVGSRGPTVVANFPVYCGVEPPAMSPPLTWSVPAGATPVDPAAVERELFALINRDRRAAGLAPVRLSDRVAAVARGHSREMARDDYVGHVSPRTGDAVARLAREGISARGIWENVSLAYSAAEAERGFMGSPGHRAAILAPQATHVGVGVAVGKSEAGPPPLYFTQLFTAGM